MNNISITGNIVRDAEIKQVGDSNVINFSICNNDESKKNEAGEYETVPSFFDCTVWSKSGKLANHLLKGKAVTVSGRLKQETWQNEEGQNRTKVVIRAFEVIPHVYEAAGAAPTSTGDSNGFGDFDTDPSDPF